MLGFQKTEEALNILTAAKTGGVCKFQFLFSHKSLSKETVLQDHSSSLGKRLIYDYLSLDVSLTFMFSITNLIMYANKILKISKTVLLIIHKMPTSKQVVIPALNCAFYWLVFPITPRMFSCIYIQ